MEIDCSFPVHYPITPSTPWIVSSFMLVSILFNFDPFHLFLRQVVTSSTVCVIHETDPSVFYERDINNRRQRTLNKTRMRLYFSFCPAHSWKEIDVLEIPSLVFRIAKRTSSVSLIEELEVYWTMSGWGAASFVPRTVLFESRLTCTSKLGTK